LNPDSQHILPMGLRIESIRSKRAINRERGLIHVRKVAFPISLCSSHRESGTTLWNKFFPKSWSAKLNDWLTEWVTLWLSDWLSEGVIEWRSEWVTDWTIDWLTKWVIDMHLFKMYSLPLRHYNERIETTGNASLDSPCALYWKLNNCLYSHCLVYLFIYPSIHPFIH
jgi:hypothetical protein